MKNIFKLILTLSLFGLFWTCSDGEYETGLTGKINLSLKLTTFPSSEVYLNVPQTISGEITFTPGPNVEENFEVEINGVKSSFDLINKEEEGKYSFTLSYIPGVVGNQKVIVKIINKDGKDSKEFNINVKESDFTLTRVGSETKTIYQGEKDITAKFKIDFKGDFQSDKFKYKITNINGVSISVTEANISNITDFSIKANAGKSFGNLGYTIQAVYQDGKTSEAIPVNINVQKHSHKATITLVSDKVKVGTQIDYNTLNISTSTAYAGNYIFTANKSGSGSFETLGMTTVKSGDNKFHIKGTNYSSTVNGSILDYKITDEYDNVIESNKTNFTVYDLPTVELTENAPGAVYSLNGFSPNFKVYGLQYMFKITAKPYAIKEISVSNNNTTYINPANTHQVYQKTREFKGLNITSGNYTSETISGSIGETEFTDWKGPITGLTPTIGGTQYLEKRITIQVKTEIDTGYQTVYSKL